ncbi:ribosome production factor 2 homolog [Corticium candelabrum]|uniref:ribosome production factor 2 homolog n=1 Tax=Corticium candelabrum TaxID=121492 RepID=UPI002E2600D4|nr:ribosome production factor 2 homolog [Corticium candelabrum]
MGDVVKPKNRRSKRWLEERVPKVHENVKSALFIRGGRTNDTVMKALKDLHALKKPDARMLQKKNILRPFEDQTSLEFFSQKSDASLFVFGTHSKKRPNNLVFGRMFNHHVLDMIELGIDHMKPMQEFQTEKCSIGCKPCLVFSGDRFDQSEDFKRLKSLLTDFFSRGYVDKMSLRGLEHVLSFTANGDQVYMRSYRTALKKSGGKIPRIELVEIGPSLDFSMRRSHLASEDLMREALKQPKELKAKKKKNVGYDAFGTKTGRIHMQRQDLSKLQTRKMKGLKEIRKKRKLAAESDSHVEETAFKRKKVA